MHRSVVTSVAWALAKVTPREALELQGDPFEGSKVARCAVAHSTLIASFYLVDRAPATFNSRTLPTRHCFCFFINLAVVEVGGVPVRSLRNNVSANTRCTRLFETLKHLKPCMLPVALLS